MRWIHKFHIWRRQWFDHHYVGSLLGVVAAGGIIFIRGLGALQVWELHAFDWMMVHRFAEPADERVVIIGINETDIENTQNAGISDRMLAEVIEVIQQQNPTVIGLDFFRNVPRDEGYERLNQIFQETPNIIGIEKVIDDVALSAVSGNPVLSAKHQVAASDLIVDVDGRVRRGLLVPNASGVEGLAFRVALEYLASHDIFPNPNPDVLELGYGRLPPLEKNSGGYSNTDAGGYQIVMNWRANLTFQTFSAQDVLTGKIPPGTLSDKIVLIGSMQSGDADVFFTPYSSSRDAIGLLPSHGIEIHASLTSQIISAAFGQRSPIKMLPEHVEILLIGIFAWLGISLYRLGRSDLQRLQMFGGFTLVTLGVSHLALMWGGWWLPVVPMSLSLLSAPLMTRLHKINRLQTLSEIDELTQLANRRSFQEHLAQEWQRALRSHTPISLILCDVDFFKLYNDTYGHPQGDECLKQVAQAIGRAVRRPDDLAARYGGEEFVILLPNTTVEGAQQVARDAAESVQALKMEHSASKVSPYVSISLGVTTVIPTVELSASVLVDTADLGLYEAKRRGRNQMKLRLPWAIE
ncbi:MAG: diguanylate cyclase [Phormidesmis sp. RL_2_1]|nr:diguanylate cyclase [Phormidesmis sp. RL_2_1]